MIDAPEKRKSEILLKEKGYSIGCLIPYNHFIIDHYIVNKDGKDYLAMVGRDIETGLEFSIYVYDLKEIVKE